MGRCEDGTTPLIRFYLSSMLTQAKTATDRLNGESDTEILFSQGSSQDFSAPPALMKPFERMLNKALKQTSEHITNSLTKEIREIGNRAAALELKMDEIENTAQDFMTESENIKEENSILQSRLEDYENRARRSNLRIRVIPESIITTIFSVTDLFQELQPAKPIERLEMERVHHALTSKKLDGPLVDIIAKFHYYHTKDQSLAAAQDKDTLTF